jgi:alpha-galactosidase
MIKKLYLFFIISSILCACSQFSQNNNGEEGQTVLEKVQRKPPMGWNSYNCYGATVQEGEVKANAKFMAKHLKKFGWEYVVVDYCWFYPHPPQSTQNNPPQFRLPKDSALVPWLPMDEYSRLLPDPRKFPSSKNGNGLKQLADYVHDLGLKFGLHVMRGIPRQAVWAETSIKGVLEIDASMIADTSSICSWLNTMYGVNMDAEGSQQYYNSLFELYASWGVDYIKLDDAISPYHETEIEAIEKAIKNSGRQMVLSLSPGITNFSKAEHVSQHGNLFRISPDFWDEWPKLKTQFKLVAQWNEYRSPGHWPDLDMLQLGRLSRRGPVGPPRYSRFTWNEKITHMSLWAISRSPLMFGGDLPMNGDSVNNLITNEEIIRVNQQGSNPKQYKREEGKVIWVSNVPEEVNAKYVAFFNLNDNQSVSMEISFLVLGLKDTCKIRDLWKKKNIGTYKCNYSTKVEPHAAKIVKIKQIKCTI